MENQGTQGFWISPQQSHVWSLMQENRASGVACAVAITGRTNAGAVERLLQQIATKYEALRVDFLRPQAVKLPFQVRRDKAEVAFEGIDLTTVSEVEQTPRLNEIWDRLTTSPAGLESEPALRAIYVSLGEHSSKLFLTAPLMRADVKSLHVLVRELAQQLASPAALGDEPLHYIQYAQWQSDVHEGVTEGSADGREFWQTTAADLPNVMLPYERGANAPYSPAKWTCSVDSVVDAKVRSAAADMNTSIANVLLASWQAVLWRLTGEKAFNVGVCFDGRQFDELQDAVGLFEKTIPVKAQFDGDLRFREVVAQVAKGVSEVEEWQEHFVPGTGSSNDSVLFEFRDAFAPQTYDDFSLTVERCDATRERYKLKVTVADTGAGLDIEFHYDGGRYDAALIQRVAGYFQNLLSAAVKDPNALVSSLPLMSDAERQQVLVNWNDTAADYSRDRCFQELFEEQVSRTPDRLAVRCGDRQLTYRELNERANQMAHYLRELGARADSAVGLYVDRSVDMMVALLGILKSGAAYVPLHPDNPTSRLAQQIVGMTAVITERKLLTHMPRTEAQLLSLDDDQHRWNNRPRNNPERLGNSDNLAYVIYTSGSTGVPKGVAVRHRNLVNYAHFIIRRLQLATRQDGLHFATVSTISADLGNTCIFPALISGGSLHVISYELSTDAERMARYMAEHPIDVLKIVPSHLRSLLSSVEGRYVLPHKYLVLGGETLSPNLVEQILALKPECEIFNHYGPTETTVGSLTLRLSDYDFRSAKAASIPIGRPIDNTQIYIVDARRQPVPIGVVGELYIAGDGVAAGYLNQPERTAERFVANPFAKVADAKMYRTGDLARYLPDGNIEFIGRADDQVKVRGFRIELGEIEAALAKHKDVRQSAVVVKEDETGEKRLLGYVVTHAGREISSDDLRVFLRGHLPDYMLPSTVVVLPNLPLTANGKIDRQALPSPESVVTKPYVAPEGAVEEGIASIWQEVLHRDKISADDNFFDLGGHSLLATQIISRMRERYKVELPVRALFDSPTVRGLAHAVSNAELGSSDSGVFAIVPVAREAYRASSLLVTSMNDQD